MSRILIPLPDADFDVTEVSVPWRLLTDDGHEVVFATEAGGHSPQGDPRLLSGVLFGQLGAASEAKRFYAEMLRSTHFKQPIDWGSIQPGDFDGLVLPGGHAPGMRQYLGSRLLQEKAAEFWLLDRPVAAICHGVLVLARSRDPRNGRSILRHVRTTCLPKYMERSAYYLTRWKLGRYYRTYPQYVEDEVKACLENPETQFARGPITLTAKGTRHAFVVQDGRYISARWPGDAYLFAQELMALVNRRPVERVPDARAVSSSPVR